MQSSPFSSNNLPTLFSGRPGYVFDSRGVLVAALLADHALFPSITLSTMDR
jgi:hypothetical protein